MTNSELLSALSGMMDDKLQPLKDDVQILKEEAKEIREDTEVLKKDVEHIDDAVQILKDGILVLNLKMENDISPRLHTIEECYTSTFYRYRDGIVQLDKMQTDVDVLKSVVRDHSQKMQKI